MLANGRSVLTRTPNRNEKWEPDAAGASLAGSKKVVGGADDGPRYERGVDLLELNGDVKLGGGKVTRDGLAEAF